MRKYIILALGILVAVSAFSQRKTFPENFDGTITYPALTWKIDKNYYFNPPNAVLGEVPHIVGDSVVLTTAVYDFRGYANVQLRFNHICKVSPSDVTRIEYKRSGMANWAVIPPNVYKGKAVNYGSTGFNAASYAEWNGKDSTEMPLSSWWKEEVFDVGYETSQENGVQFRFILKHGSVLASEISYGWLIDNIEITIDNEEINPPIVEFIFPLIRDTAFGVGPWNIDAQVKSTTAVGIIPPWMKYTATYNGNIVGGDSIPMTMITGDSWWRAEIPAFEIGTEVLYSIMGIDSLDNYTVATSQYVIAKGYGGEIAIGTGTNTSSTSPYYLYCAASWTRAIYYDWEINPRGLGGLISSIAYYNTNTGTSTVDSLSVYVKATKDKTITTALYIDPVADGATQVWGNAPHVSDQGWNTFTFYSPFYLPPGYNLMIYWVNNTGYYDYNYDSPYWRYTEQSVNNHIQATNYNASLPASGNINNERPNVKVDTRNTDIKDNSAFLSSIDIKDTIIILQGSSIPVIATVFNTGHLPLSSVNTFYSVNGVVYTGKTFQMNPALSWDFHVQDTVGYYTPKLNGWDTIVVWISMPNGVMDNITYDDTLSKAIFGSGDILMEFVNNTPADTVYTTGPFKISARIQSQSGTAFGPVSLNMITTYGGIATSSTLPMIFSSANNAWEATIPHTVFGTTVAYSVTLTDRLTNVITIADSFYISRPPEGVSGYVIIGTETNFSYVAPVNVYYNYGFSRQLYLGTEFSDNATGGMITKLSWDYASGGAWNAINQTCYFQAVDDAAITTNAYIDPTAVGATLVWSGPLSVDGSTGWTEIVLDNPFMLPSGKNLLIYWEQKFGGPYINNMPQWNYTSTSFNSLMRGFDDNSFSAATTTNLYLSGSRPNARFYIEAAIAKDTSVALAAIYSPTSAEVAGVSVPVEVQIRNKGQLNLKDYILNWSKNGILQGSYPYTCDLPEDFTETVTIDHYIPSLEQYDTIKVWVSMPNGIADEIMYDDTLQLVSLGCGNMAGTKTVGGSGGDYPNLNTILTIIKTCGLAGDLTLQLKDTFAEAIDLRTISDAMNGHHLTITSFDNHPDSAIILATSAVGITLGNNRNITIQNITVKSTSSSHCIQFTNACTNILIRDCKLLADTITTSYSAGRPILKDYNTGVVDSIFIIHNLLEGGNYGFYFQGGTGTGAGRYGTNIIFDSNTVRNQYNSAIYNYYNDFISHSYNTILSRTTNLNTYWSGIQMSSCNGDMIGNRIIQRTASITNPTPIQISSYNIYNTADTGLIANNEIIMNTTQDNYAIYLYSAHAKILHNSIYVSGNRAARGIYVDASQNDILEIKNNNIVMRSANAHPIYLNSTTYLSQYDIDANNMYVPTYVGFAGGDITNIKAWQQIITTDQHSVVINPSFVNPVINLELSNVSRMHCDAHPDVSVDINGKLRLPATIFGAYSQDAVTQDLAVENFVSWIEESIKDQSLPVNIDIRNLCHTTPVTTATFGWSVDGVTQTPTVWNASEPLQPYEMQNVYIGSFPAAGIDDTVKVVVWLESYNGQPDLVKNNDTISIFSIVNPLAEFTAPFVHSVITDLEFTVSTLIRPETGAPYSAPKMHLHTKINGENLYDSVTMIQNGNIWQAHIPPQYYGSTVIYSTTIFDAEGNSITLTDSTFIHYVVMMNDTVSVVGTGMSTTYYNSPYNAWSDKGWSRSIYMGWEINPSRQGGIITQIAYYNTNNATSNVDDISLYFKAVSDDVITYNNYLDPIGDGATLVWGKATASIFGAGWVVFTLHTPFYLPPDSNLMVYCNNEDGYSSNNGTAPEWQYTMVGSNKNIRSFGYGAAFPTRGEISVNDNRPNAQFKMRGSSPYTGYNLGILAFTEPVNKNIGGSACSEEYVPLKIVLANMGGNDYDFSANNVTLNVEASNAISYSITKIIDVDSLKSGSIDTVEITPVFPVFMPGQYEIKVWLTSAIDNIAYDDTITSLYISERLGLPVDENFSGSFPIEFVSRAISSPAKWEVVTQGVGPDVNLVPAQGTGMLALTGGKGTMAHLSTRQLELRGTTLPTLEFWYFHDTLPSKDYMDVRITTDGGETYTLLKSLLKQGSTYGWEQYTIDLTPYTNGQCINILFEAMQASAGVTSQYIDRIFITSSPDLALSEIVITPEASVCGLTNRNVSVKINTTTNQPIDFSQYSASLALEVPGYPTFDVPLQGILGGNSSNTILIASDINIPKGVSSMKAYLTAPVDNNPSNDTITLALDISPALSVTINPITQAGSCSKIGSPVYQDIVIRNTGTVDLTGIELMLVINGTYTTEIVKEPVPIDLAVNESRNYLFTTPYIVPDGATYQVRINAYLGCDSAWVNRSDAVGECSDLHNLRIVSIDNPQEGQTNVSGSSHTITVSLENWDDVNSFENVSIFAVIEDETGQVQTNRWGTIDRIEPSRTQPFTFTEAYTIPDDTTYIIRVYLANVDVYPEDDTLSVKCYTESVGIETLNGDIFTLNQNIPNPAGSSTRIDYSIPEAGEVIFHVHSVSGQLLYSKTIEAANGKQSLELNTSTFAAGIYFYSIEYKGQRLIKRMMINN